jgi:prepilin-type N-terminal cleavage/methylation domain-containing protein
MNKKGFSIIELLVVIVVLGIVSTIACIGYNKIIESSNISALQAKRDVILDASRLYGDEHRLLIDTSCSINGHPGECLEIKVQDLIDENYLTGYEKCKESGLDKCIYNNVTKELMNNDAIVIYNIYGSLDANFKANLKIEINQ